MTSYNDALLSQIAAQFTFQGSFRSATPYGGGHINDTYRVECRDPDVTYILQRINHHVFKRPMAVMENIARVTAHLRQKIIQQGGDPRRETLTLIPTRKGEMAHVTPAGDTWRAFEFIAGARTYAAPQNLGHYYHAARAFGRFQRLLGDFPAGQLHETIPGFHNTPQRLSAFFQAVDANPCGRACTVRAEIEFVRQRAGEAHTLTDLQAQRAMPLRVVHNDTKLDNVMIDEVTGEGICVIDLDTVMPGPAVLDFGDAVRSGANPAPEDEPDLSKVVFDLGRFDRLVHGYLDETRDFLTPVELAHLTFAARLITFEQGVRFLTDYLNGDFYYKTSRPGHNLDRCCTQFKLVQEMELHAEAMERIIRRRSQETSDFNMKTEVS